MLSRNLTVMRVYVCNLCRYYCLPFRRPRKRRQCARIRGCGRKYTDNAACTWLFFAIGISVSVEASAVADSAKLSTPVEWPCLAVRSESIAQPVLAVSRSIETSPRPTSQRDLHQILQLSPSSGSTTRNASDERARESRIDPELPEADIPDEGVPYNARKFAAINPGLRHLRRQGRQQGVTGSVFEADISGAPTEEHVEAIRYCMELASQAWDSSQLVRVSVRFRSFGSSLTLGTGQPSRNWLLDGVQMPMALAKAIEQADLNAALSGDNFYDVLIELNSLTNWYTKTDAQTADSTFDLVTVCLHETYHGLLMSGSNIEVAFSDEVGTFVARHVNPGKIGRFDQFMANHENCNIEGYKFNQTQLGAVLTSNNLFFVDSAGRRVGELFAPRPNIGGSSLYHLSESAYSSSGSDDLMTPIINMAYSQHNVGLTVRDMQAVMLDFDGQPAARTCEQIGEPILTSNPVEQTNGDEGSSGRQNGIISSFSVTLFGKTLSGWVVVGVGVAVLVVLVMGIRLATCRCRGRPVERPQRHVKREEAVARISGGNEDLV